MLCGPDAAPSARGGLRASARVASSLSRDGASRGARLPAPTARRRAISPKARRRSQPAIIPTRATSSRPPTATSRTTRRSGTPRAPGSEQGRRSAPRTSSHGISARRRRTHPIATRRTQRFARSRRGSGGSSRTLRGSTSFGSTERTSTHPSCTSRPASTSPRGTTEGVRVRKVVTVRAGEQVSVTVAPEAKPSPAARPAEEPRRGSSPSPRGSQCRRSSPSIGGVLTAVAGGFTIASGLDTVSKRDAFLDDKTQDRLDTRVLEPGADQRAARDDNRARRGDERHRGLLHGVERAAATPSREASVRR